MARHNVHGCPYNCDACRAEARTFLRGLRKSYLPTEKGYKMLTRAIVGLGGRP